MEPVKVRFVLAWSATVEDPYLMLESKGEIWIHTRFPNDWNKAYNNGMMHIEQPAEGKEVHTVDKCIILFRDKTPSALLRLDEEGAPYYLAYREDEITDKLLAQWVDRKSTDKTFKTALSAEELVNDCYLAMGRALEEATS